MNHSEIYKFVDEDKIDEISNLEDRYKFLSKGVPTESGHKWLNWAMKLKNTENYIGTIQAFNYREQIIVS